MSRLALRGRVICRVVPNAAPEDVASQRDVTNRHQEYSPHVDGGGAIDRVLRRFSAGMQVSRVYHARQNIANPGRRHLDFTDDEQQLGLSRTLRIAIDPDAPLPRVLAHLNDLDAVESATPEWLCKTPFGPRAQLAELLPAPREVDWAQQMIGLPAALDTEPGDTAIIVGLVDSGVAMRHPELSGRLRPGLTTCDLADDPMDPGVALVRPPPHGQDVSDDEGHGTACAGIMVANGYQIFRGCAGVARLLPVKALIGAYLSGQASATAVGSLADIDAGLKTCIDLDARVINLSFGTPETDLDPGDPIPHQDIVRYAESRGCVLVAASGNQGDRVKYYPAALPTVIAVGSIDEDGAPSRFSSRGPHVVLCAPGERIVSSGLDGYSLNNGTSFAAPFVTGACALVLSRASRQSIGLSAAGLRTLLARSARPFSKSVAAAGCGAGILDVRAALAAVDEEHRQT